ncbi:MAG: hypothetical protein Q9178_005761 [Gyalolechia marmorata]
MHPETYKGYAETTDGLTKELLDEKTGSIKVISCTVAASLPPQLFRVSLIDGELQWFFNARTIINDIAGTTHMPYIMILMMVFRASIRLLMAASPTTEYYGNPYLRGIKVSLISKGATAIPTLVRSIINICDAKSKSSGPARQALLIDFEISVEIDNLYLQGLVPVSDASVPPRYERRFIRIRLERGKETQVATGVPIEHELSIIKQYFDTPQEVILKLSVHTAC